jgi:hypothetical protein
MTLDTVEKPLPQEATMETKLEPEVKANKIIVAKPVTAEYSVIIDGVIEFETSIDDKIFFDGLFAAMIEYVEKHNASAGLSISHKPYQEEDDNHDDGVSDDREAA